MPKTDIAIVTVIPEEYQAVVERLKAVGCQLTSDPGPDDARTSTGG
jgi:hypothetical protein